MANFIYLPALLNLANGTIDPDNDDLRLILVKSGHTSANTDEFVGDFADLDECDGTGYTPGPGGTGRKALGSKSWGLDVPNERAEMQGASFTWASLGDDAGPGVAAILYKHISDSDDTLNPAIAYFDEGGFPFPFSADTPTPAGFTLEIPAEGLLQVEQG